MGDGNYNAVEEILTALEWQDWDNNRRCAECGYPKAQHLPRCRVKERIQRVRELLGMSSLSEGARRIAAERRRQIEVEGWTSEHDDQHEQGELVLAAVQLAIHRYDGKIEDPNDSTDFWGLIEKHGHDPIRSLVIAGALIAAELDRLLREAG